MTHVFEGEFVHQNLGRIRKELRVDQMCEWETRKAAVRGLFFCEHGIVIDTCEEFDHLGEQAMQYLKIALREKDTQVIPFCADGTYWVPVEAGEAKDMETEKWMEYYQCDQKRFWKFQRYFYEWTGEIPMRGKIRVDLGLRNMNLGIHFTLTETLRHDFTADLFTERGKRDTVLREIRLHLGDSHFVIRG